MIEITELYVAMAVGMALSLLLEEFMGISAGGIVVPGYLGLAFGEPVTVLILYAIAILTYLVINYVLPRFVILFGKRKFVATLLVAMVFKLAFDLLFPIMPFNTLAIRGIGIIVPGLLANAFAKQGIKLTVPVSAAAALAVFGLVKLIYVF